MGLQSTSLWVCLDRRGGIADMDGSVADFLGWSARQLLGSHVTMLLAPNDRGRVHEWKRRIHQEGAWSDRCGLQKFDGGIAPCRFQAKPAEKDRLLVRFEPVPDADASSAGHVALCSPREAQRMECVGVLASGMVHDFNNVLSVISLEAQLMQRFPPLEEMRPRLDKIVKSTQSASHLASQLLGAARLRDNSPTAPLLLRPMLKELRRLLADAFSPRAALALIIRDEGAYATIRPSEFQQIVLNLCRNAYEAIGNDGRIDVELTAETESDKRFIRLEVRDTGPGFSDDALASAGEKGFTTKANASGRGLTTVAAIVAERGGDLRLRNTPRGTSAIVRLPEAPRPAVAVPTNASEAPAIDLSGKTILVVEDSEDFLSVMGAMLEETGSVVHSAADGEAMWRMLEELPAPPDAILLDVILRGRSGTSLAGQIAKRFPAVPVILMSGLGDRPAIRACLESGTAVEFLPKPFFFDDLARTLHRVFSLEAEG